MEPIFSSFFGIVDMDSNVIRYWGDGSEIMEGTTYDDAARFTARVLLDRQASGVLRFKLALAHSDKIISLIV